MISETVYLQRIFEHNAWHQSEQGEPPIDLSCIICHPATEEHLTPAFRNFWNFWIVLNCKGQTYTKYTCLYFQQVCGVKKKSEKDYQLSALIKTIRYSQLIQPGGFEKIKSNISSYWVEIESEVSSEVETNYSILEINSSRSEEHTSPWIGEVEIPDFQGETGRHYEMDSSQFKNSSGETSQRTSGGSGDKKRENNQ